jgi:ferredoxin
VTFFRGDKAAAEEHFSKRVSEIVHANPWLASVLEYDENGIMAVYYPSCPNVACKLCHLEVRDDINVSRLRPDGQKLLYQEMVQTLESALCKTSVKSVGTSEPLFKVSLIPDAEEPLMLFSLVVSANHSLLDGHGYYRIFNMLSSDCEVQALSPVRKQDMPSKILEAMGGEPSLMAESPPGFLLHFIGGNCTIMCFRPPKPSSGLLSRTTTTTTTTTTMM